MHFMGYCEILFKYLAKCWCSGKLSVNGYVPRYSNQQSTGNHLVNLDSVVIQNED